MKSLVHLICILIFKPQLKGIQDATLHWLLQLVVSMWLPTLVHFKSRTKQVQVLKMHQDVGIVSQTTHNLELFDDLEVMFGLSYIVPLLEGLNKLIIFSFSWQWFVCDFVIVVKLCQTNFYCYYTDLQIAYMGDVFNGYENLPNGTLDVVVHEWALNLNTSLENLGFQIASTSIMMYSSFL